MRAYAGMRQQHRYFAWPKGGRYSAQRFDLQVTVHAPGQIDIDEKANLTLFDPNFDWEFKAENNFSKSKNSPWLNKKLKGKAVAVFNNGKSKIED